MMPCFFYEKKLKYLKQIFGIKYEIKSQIYVAKREKRDIIKIEWRVKRYVMSVYCEELQEYKR